MAVILLIVIVFVVVLIARRDDPMVKTLGKGKTAEQINALRYFYNKGCLAKKISDDEYASMVREHCNSLNLRQRGIGKTGIDEEEIQEISPITFDGYTYDNTPQPQHVKEKINGGWASSNYQVTWLFFSATQIYIYMFTFSMTDNKTIEHTEEFFYKDVTSIATDVDTINIKMQPVQKGCLSSGKTKRKGKNGNADQYVDVTTNRLKFVVPGEKMYVSIESLDNRDIQGTVQGLKQKLREKKM